MTYHRSTIEAAKGKWRGILLELGVPESALRNKHGPCPMCGGTDRFRWDNNEGSGSYICGQCGAGTGMQLAINFTGREFRDVASEIDRMVGNLKVDAPSRPPISADDRRRLLVETYKATVPIAKGDLADLYLASRHLDEPTYPKALRFGASLRDGEGGVRPALVAMVGVPGAERYCSMHRTFLAPHGRGKAEMASPRKMMPGELPVGACVALSDYVPGGPLGIAEGIETAMGASNLYDMPVWAAISSATMRKWVPPEGCSDVVIFGDHDPKFGGHAAAWELAHRLAVKEISVTVKIPDKQGQDWADVWANTRQT